MVKCAASSFSIMTDSIMGLYWSKKLLGETIHRRRRMMESHVHKLLLTDGLFTKDCDEEYSDIVKASGGNRYAALHNMLRLHHPRLTDRKVETKIPTQSISMRFGHHIRAIQDHLFREETRGRTYSKYEALQLVLDTLHPSFHMDLKFRAKKEFGQAHDFDDRIHFKLQMSQLGTTLTSLSNEMRLSEKKAPRILHIIQEASNDDESYGDPGIFALSDEMKCSLCGRTDHDYYSCHNFMNHIIGDALMKSHAKEAARISRENKQFVTVGPRGTPRSGNERTDLRPPSAIAFISDMSPHITGAALCGRRRNYAGAYIVQMEHIPVFNTAAFVQACATVCTSLLAHAKTTITVTVAPERKEALRDPGCSPQLHVDQFRPVVRTLFEMWEGRSITADEMPDDDEISHAIRSISVCNDIGVKVGPSPDLGNAPYIEYVEGTLPGSSWTRRHLRKLSCWPRWKKSEMAQLDSMKKDGMYGPPCFSPKGAIVLCTVWTYYVKWDGTLRSRSCCDGSVLKGLGLSYALHYTACISQPGMRIFWAIVVIRGWVAVEADAINTFAQADPPK
jgi:hypothetical protein